MKDKILELKNQGKSHKEISILLNCAKSTVSYHCNRNNILHTDTKLKQEVINNIIDLFNDGLSKIDISSILSISTKTIRKYTQNIQRLSKYDDLTKKQRWSVWVKSKRLKYKKLAVEYKGGECMKCGYSKCMSALEFHHINPNEKDFGISQDGLNKSWDKIKKELDKCILVCANCHREIHESIKESTLELES